MVEGVCSGSTFQRKFEEIAQSTNLLVLQNTITSHHYSIASITFTKLIFKSFESDFFTLQVDTLFISGNVLVAE
jgi:hypothetical protein